MTPARAAFGLGLLALGACADDAPATGGATTSRVGDAGPCAAGELALDGGRCLAAGIREDGCPAGETFVEGACVPSGVPPDECGDGFAPDQEGGCRAVLPPEACAAGTMAVPGDTECRQVAPCAGGPWGSAPQEPTTQYVDVGYAGAGSDGTADKPWTSVAGGIAAALDGAVVAVAPGTYDEAIWIDKPVRLWGRCPAEVEIDGGASPGIVVTADGVEIHDLAVRSESVGLGVANAEGVLADRVWVHACGDYGVDLEVTSGQGSLRLERSLVEETTEVGVQVQGGRVEVVDSCIRGIQHTLRPARGVAVQAYGVPGSIDVSGSVVEGVEGAGVLTLGEAHLSRTSIRDPRAGVLPSDSLGVLANFDRDAGIAPDVRLDAVVVERVTGYGILDLGGTLAARAVTVRDVAEASDTRSGYCITIGVDVEAGLVATGTVERSSIARCADDGLVVAGAHARVERLSVRDVAGGVDGPYGIGVDVRAYGGFAAGAELSGCSIDRATIVGLLVSDADVSVEGTRISDTLEAPGDRTGAGAVAQSSTQAVATALSLRSCSIEGSTQAGVLGIASDIAIEATRIVGTHPAAGASTPRSRGMESNRGGSLTCSGSVVDGSGELGALVSSATATFDTTIIENVAATSLGTFGDGLVASDGANASVSRCRIEAPARAGLVAFAADLTLSDTVVECAAIPLDREAWEGRQGTFVDAGGNACGCEGVAAECRAVSSTLAPPSPVDPAEPP